MTAAAANPKAPRKAPARSMTHHADLGVVCLTVGKEPATGYYLDRSPAGWAWTKFGTREVYTVAGGRCDCKGHARWNRCKHEGATAKLLGLGRIS